MAKNRVARRLAAILTIDVAGYSRMMEQDASGVLSALNAIFRTVVKPRVSRSNGRIVKLLGDGALIEFSSALEALNCAAAIQGEMRAADPPYRYREPIFLRIGIHASDILIEGEDVFGDGVNIAARLQGEAEAGGVMLSKTVAELAGGDLPYRLRGEGARKFKNIASPVETLSIDFTDEKVVEARRRIAKSVDARFCKSKDGQTLAWTSFGQGPPIVKAPSWVTDLELMWRDPGLAHLLESLSTGRRLVYFDARGNGLSDREVKSISFEGAVDDLESVFDAAGIDRAPVFGISQGGAIAVAFAVRAPERVSAIVMLGSYPRGRSRRASAKDRERAEAIRSLMTAGWDDEYPSLRDLIAQTIIPVASLEEQRQFAEDMRAMISPETMGRYREMLDNIDITPLLPKVQAPCLVIHCKGDRMQPVEQGRMMAAGIPNARFLALDSNNHNLTENDPCWPLAERQIHTFLNEIQ